MQQHAKTPDKGSMPELQSDAERALVACSLWLHIGFIGAAALAAGLLQLFDSEASWLSALALAFSGCVLAAASWRHARTVLEDVERTSAVAGDAPRAASRSASGHTGRMLSPISTAIEPKAR
jgi:hypothetical protein